MDTVQIGGFEYDITPGSYYRTRTEKALAETYEKLAQALSHSEDFRDHDLIEFYRSHIAKLEAMLA